jgi:hypothetical protein
MGKSTRPRVKRTETPVGVIRPDTGALKTLPRDFTDDGDEQGPLRPHLVVVVITLLFLLYIGVVAWYVSQMPPKN